MQPALSGRHRQIKQLEQQLRAQIAAVRSGLGMVWMLTSYARRTGCSACPKLVMR